MTVNIPPARSPQPNSCGVGIKTSNDTNYMDNEGPSFSPASLFAFSPDGHSITLDSLQFTGNSSNQDFLFDVNSYASVPQAELLDYHFWTQMAENRNVKKEEVMNAMELSSMRLIRLGSAIFQVQHCVNNVLDFGDLAFCLIPSYSLNMMGSLFFSIWVNLGLFGDGILKMCGWFLYRLTDCVLQLLVQRRCYSYIWGMDLKTKFVYSVANKLQKLFCLHWKIKQFVGMSWPSFQQNNCFVVEEAYGSGGSLGSFVDCLELPVWFPPQFLKYQIPM